MLQYMSEPRAQAYAAAEVARMQREEAEYARMQEAREAKLKEERAAFFAWFNPQVIEFLEDKGYELVCGQYWEKDRLPLFPVSRPITEREFLDKLVGMGFKPIPPEGNRLKDEGLGH